MRPHPSEPEILPPSRTTQRGPGSLDDETLDALAALLDDQFRIPGTAIRFGVDALIGLIPGLGDLIGGCASFIIIVAARQRGIPRHRRQDDGERCD
jgi:hypothetical protein